MLNPFSIRQFALFGQLLLAVLLVYATLSPAFAQSGQPQKQRVLMEARLSAGGPIIRNGIEWRIFSTGRRFDRSVQELAFSYGGSKAFDIPSGEYLVHAAYGHAGVVRKITVGNTASREEFTLNAGGLRLMATASGNVPLPERMLRFDIFEAKFDENGNRKLLARDIKANQVIAFPIGTYHVISYFGDLNAQVRADLRVEPGKLTEASLEHRAALIRFRLVRNDGGDANRRVDTDLPGLAGAAGVRAGVLRVDRPAVLPGPVEPGVNPRDRGD